MGAGTRLKKLLDEKNVTVKELSLMSGVSINTLYGITKRDNATIKSDILIPISDVLGVPPQYILGLDGYQPSWTKEELHEFESDEFIDTEDGLLIEIIKICKEITTGGRLETLEYLKSIKDKYLSPETIQSDLTYNEWNNLRIKELNSMYQDGKMSDIDFQKLSLMLSKNLYIPFPHSNNKDDIIYQDDERLHSYLFEINNAVNDKIISKEYLVSQNLYEKTISENTVCGFLLKDPNNSHSDEE